MKVLTSLVVPLALAIGSASHALPAAVADENGSQEGKVTLTGARHGPNGNVEFDATIQLDGSKAEQKSQSGLSKRQVYPGCDVNEYKHKDFWHAFLIDRYKCAWGIPLKEDEEDKKKKEDNKKKKQEEKQKKKEEKQKKKDDEKKKKKSGKKDDKKRTVARSALGPAEEWEKAASPVLNKRFLWGKQCPYEEDEPRKGPWSVFVHQWKCQYKYIYKRDGVQERASKCPPGRPEDIGFWKHLVKQNKCSWGLLMHTMGGHPGGYLGVDNKDKAQKRGLTDLVQEQVKKVIEAANGAVKNLKNGQEIEDIKQMQNVHNRRSMLSPERTTLWPGTVKPLPRDDENKTLESLNTNYILEQLEKARASDINHTDPDPKNLARLAAAALYGKSLNSTHGMRILSRDDDNNTLDFVDSKYHKTGLSNANRTKPNPHIHDFIGSIFWHMLTDRSLNSNHGMPVILPRDNDNNTTETQTVDNDDDNVDDDEDNDSTTTSSSSSSPSTPGKRADNEKTESLDEILKKYSDLQLATFKSIKIDIGSPETPKINLTRYVRHANEPFEAWKTRAASDITLIEDYLRLRIKHAERVYKEETKKDKVSMKIFRNDMIETEKKHAGGKLTADRKKELKQFAKVVEAALSLSRSEKVRKWTRVQEDFHKQIDNLDTGR